MRVNEPKRRSLSEKRKNKSSALILAAELGFSVPELDVHGMDRNSAGEELERWLQAEFMKGSPIVRIIHGRGEGILKKVIGEALERHPLVEYHQAAESPEALGAVVYVVLAPNK